MNAGKKTKVFGFAFMALLLLLGAMLIFMDAYKKRTCTHPVTATISEIKVKYEPVGDQSERRAYPVFAYVFDGEEYEANSYVTVNDKKVKVGDRVRIFVNPNVPTEIYLQTNEMIIMGCVLMGIPAIMVAWGLINKAIKDGKG